MLYIYNHTHVHCGSQLNTLEHLPHFLWLDTCGPEHTVQEQFPVSVVQRGVVRDDADTLLGFCLQNDENTIVIANVPHNEQYGTCECNRGCS